MRAGSVGGWGWSRSCGCSLEITSSFLPPLIQAMRPMIRAHCSIGAILRRAAAAAALMGSTTRGGTGGAGTSSSRQLDGGEERAVAVFEARPREQRRKPNGRISGHQRSNDFHRQLAESADQAFRNWTPARASRAMPLDLRIDKSSSVAYVSGHGGFLEPYEKTFARIGAGEDVSSEYWDGIVSVSEIVDVADSHIQGLREPHQHPDRLYYKILEEDRIERTTSHGLRKRGESNRRLNDEESVHLESIQFGPSSASEGKEEVGHSREESEQDENESTSKQDGRSLLGSGATSSDSLQQGDSSSKLNMTPLRRNKTKNKNKNKNQQGNKRQKSLPQVQSIFPSKGGRVRGKQTFGARILPSVATGSPVRKVTFQLIDHTGSKSDWLDVPQKSDDMYEITVNGFEKYPSTRWRWILQASDKKGRTRTVQNSFKVQGPVGGGGHGGGKTNLAPKAPTPARAPSSPSRPMVKTKVSDSDWPHVTSSIQASTGRIMFEFEGHSSQSFVCSGTVVCDGRRGQVGDSRNGRSVVQTAAHCAYNDVLKRFATKAIFVPDQDSTTGDKSDFDCRNDIYGCWHLSFAVAAEGWTGASFPDNVPYDYAYYTVFDDPKTHTGGWTPGLTGILDSDVPCVPIDFDRNLRRPEFVWSIGYSADQDPHLRHCSMENTVIQGVPWYVNLWLEDCAMTGGASGGPWISDMDESGRGTLTSVNSWGFTHKAGMAGPNFRTGSGSMAECLFDRARGADDPGREGGIIVSAREC